MGRPQDRSGSPTKGAPSPTLRVHQLPALGLPSRSNGSPPTNQVLKSVDFGTVTPTSIREIACYISLQEQITAGLVKYNIGIDLHKSLDVKNVRLCRSVKGRMK
ncbi:MAG: hypothetical protein ACHBN1_10565 [Heteroscytonema crispum UTEX LB 1556]